MSRLVYLLCAVLIGASMLINQRSKALISSATITSDITAGVTVMDISSNSIVLNLTATNASGGPIAGWNVYRDGLWIAAVPNPAFKLAAPSGLKVQ